MAAASGAAGPVPFSRASDLNTPLLFSNTDAKREVDLNQMNGKLYTVEKAQFDKSCPAVANASPSSVVR